MEQPTRHSLGLLYKCNDKIAFDVTFANKVCVIDFKQFHFWPFCVFCRSDSVLQLFLPAHLVESSSPDCLPGLHVGAMYHSWGLTGLKYLLQLNLLLATLENMANF